MRSRVLVGAGAWLLGAVSATAGSLYTVDQLAQGLFAQHTKQVSVAMVNAELAQDGASTPAQTPSPGPSPKASPKASRTVHKARPVSKNRAPKPVTRNASKLLTSSGGTAVAFCQPGGAYLLSWSPAQNYDVHDFVRGPSAVASVTFASNSAEVVLRVTCGSSGVPIPHVTTKSWGGHGDD